MKRRTVVIGAALAIVAGLVEIIHVGRGIWQTVAASRGVTAMSA